jgi:pyruvate carboxylase
MKSISPVDADGNVEVVFIMNGMPRSITIKSKKISKAAAAAAASTHRPKADKAVPGEARSHPLPHASTLKKCCVPTSGKQ